MTRLVFATAFFLGAAAVVWMGTQFIDSSLLGLIVILVIGGVYCIGFIELIQFQQATATLSVALAALPQANGDESGANRVYPGEFLDKLHPSLQNAVRGRIAGQRTGLPAPVLVPYLVGLLIMLGLLGTFVGMVDTLQGAVTALEGTTKLEAIRAGLAAPIGGLSLAFGTSVAGVAASAMLGLMSTLSRRERMLTTRFLDNKITTVFREFSLVYQQQETFKALQLQSKGLPDMTDKLCLLAEQIERMGENIGAQLIAKQDRFHASVETVYTNLAMSVDKSLGESLAASGRLAGESIKPVIQTAMTEISTEVRSATLTTCQQLSETMQTQINLLTDRFARTSEETVLSIAENSRAHLTKTLNELTSLLQSSEDLIKERIQTEQTWSHSQDERMSSLTTMLQTQLQSLRDEEALRGRAAVDRLQALEVTVANHLVTLGTALEEPMTRLMQMAGKAPQAAAEVISRLRDEISKNLEHENQLLAERTQLLEELRTCSKTLGEASAGQLKAVQHLIDTSAITLQEVGTKFTVSMDTEVAKLAEVSDHFAVSTTEMASLGDAFGLAVNLYNDSNNQLTETLSLIEAALDKSGARSAEQLAYYVAQAREVIDHSVLSQKEIFEELRQLGLANAAGTNHRLVEPAEVS